LKITKKKQPLKNPGIAGNVSVKPGTPGTVAARPLHAPPSLAARGFTRRRENAGSRGDPKRLPPPLPFCTGGGAVTCKTTKTQQHSRF